MQPTSGVAFSARAPDVLDIGGDPDVGSWDLMPGARIGVGGWLGAGEQSTCTAEEPVCWDRAGSQAQQITGGSGGLLGCWLPGPLS